MLCEFYMDYEGEKSVIPFEAPDRQSLTEIIDAMAQDEHCYKMEITRR